LSGSGKEASGADNVHGAIPEVVEDFENFEALGSSSQKPEAAHHKDDSAFQSRSGSAEGENEPPFRASASKGTESRFYGEAERQDGTGDHKESLSGSGVDSAGVNFWPVARVEFGADDRRSDRELHLIRRSEISTPEKVTRASVGYSPPVESTSGENASERRDLLAFSGSGRDITSGEDDAPFDASSADSESDSGCSSGDGCYESESEQGGDGGGVNSRSIISRAEQNAAYSPGSASGNSPPDVWSHPHFDVAAGPYDDVTSGSGEESITTGSGSVKEDEEKAIDSHEIEDAIFEAGIPLQLSRDTASGSGVPNPPQSQGYDDSRTSASGSGAAEVKESVQLFGTRQHRHRVSLMEKMMRLGKLQAIKISHENVDASSRNEVPRISDEDKASQEMQSDLGKNCIRNTAGILITCTAETGLMATPLIQVLVITVSLFWPEQKLSQSFCNFKNLFIQPDLCGPFMTGLMRVPQL